MSDAVDPKSHGSPENRRDNASLSLALALAERIPLPDGYEWSALRLEDAEEIVALLNAHSMETMGRSDRKEEDFRADWEEPGVDPGADGVVLRTKSGRVVGYEEVYDKNRHAELIFYGGIVDRGHRTPELRNALIEWMRLRCAEHVREAPPGVEVKAFTGVDSRDVDSRSWLETNGFECTRVFRVMRKEWSQDPSRDTERSLAAVGSEYKICVRGHREEIDEAFLRRFYRTQWEAFQDHWGAPVPLDSSFQRFVHQLESKLERDEALLTYVECADEIVATCLTLLSSESDPDVAFLDRLGTLAEHRGNGLARALLCDVFERTQALGKKALELSVDSDSQTGAPRLYEGVGMVETEKTFVMSQVLRPGRPLGLEDSPS